MVYSVDDRRFLPDRYVEGICPHCGYEKARGDQCDNCGNLLDPADLIEPYSVISGSRNIEIRETRHLYLLQTKLADDLRALVDTKPDWPALARSIAYKHLDEGLIDRGITRDLAWGVPVVKDGLPRPGFEDKVFYVWFDAPIEYIAATQEWADANGEPTGARWWRLDAGAAKTSAMSSSWARTTSPSTPSASRPRITRHARSRGSWSTTLKAFNWLNWYGGKFSTSQSAASSWTRRWSCCRPTTGAGT